MGGYGFDPPSPLFFCALFFLFLAVFATIPQHHGLPETLFELPVGVPIRHPSDAEDWFRIQRVQLRHTRLRLLGKPVPRQFLLIVRIVLLVFGFELLSLCVLDCCGHHDQGERIHESEHDATHTQMQSRVCTGNCCHHRMKRHDLLRRRKAEARM